jgi:hypothetical protein
LSACVSVTAVGTSNLFRAQSLKRDAGKLGFDSRQGQVCSLLRRIQTGGGNQPTVHWVHDRGVKPAVPAACAEVKMVELSSVTPYAFMVHDQLCKRRETLLPVYET